MARVDYSEQPARAALNKVQGMPFAWSLNPYVGCVHRCTFCYVRGFERRAGRPSDDRYGRAVRVKTGIVEVLRRELDRGHARDGVTIGTATDPYQPAEGRYRLTRGCIRELGAARRPIHIITRGPLIVRDIDVLLDANRHGEVKVNISIPTVDRVIWRSTEPGTAPPEQRFRAMQMLVDAGIEVSVALAPLLPGLTDTPASLRQVMQRAREAGACSAWVSMLNLRPGVREHFLDELGRSHPDEVARYAELYRSPYLPQQAQHHARDLVRGLKREVGIRDRRTNVVEPELQLSLLD